jgi:hypothetical protein
MAVFISYSFTDKRKYEDVYFALEQQGISPWTTEDIAAGEILREKLRMAIEDCVVCVFIATENSLASGWCQAEIGAFWGAGKPVVVYLGDDKLRSEELPKQFQGDKWAASAQEVVDAVKRHVREATERTQIGRCPANAFWLGHDLARAVRLAKFEQNNRTELDFNLRQALHHLEELKLLVPDARKLVLSALKTHRTGAPLSDKEREELITDIAKAKNEVGDRIAQLQPKFRGYPTVNAQNKLDQDVGKPEQIIGGPRPHPLSVRRNKRVTHRKAKRRARR